MSVVLKYRQSAIKETRGRMDKTMLGEKGGEGFVDKASRGKFKGRLEIRVCKAKVAYRRAGCDRFCGCTRLC